MDTKLIAGVVVGALVIGGGSFYGGMQYANQARASERGQFATFTGRGGAGAGARFGGGASGGFTAGTIVAMDPTSITVQLGGPNASSTNGTASGSKIVLYNGSTQIGKFTAGTAKDLAVGDSVTIMGSANSDGSITAQNIQIRPTGMGPRGGGQ